MMVVLRPIYTSAKSDDGSCLRYISKDKKTENKKYVSTINCSLHTAYLEFRNTRELYNNTDGVKYYHFVQSHPKDSNIDPAFANRIAVEFAERAFSGHECVVATHVDKDHIHSHIVLNSVNPRTGLKYHWFGQQDLLMLRLLSDEICRKHGLEIGAPPVIFSKTSGITSREYHCAMNGKSWKIELIKAINNAMKTSDSKEAFCLKMKQSGYDVDWNDEFKNIMFTCPSGYRCSDRKLHDEKYLKENMENEFKIRGNDRSFKSEPDRSIWYSENNNYSRTQMGGFGFSDGTAHGYGYGDEGSYGYDYDHRADEFVPEKSAYNIRSDEDEYGGYSERDTWMPESRDEKNGEEFNRYLCTGWEAERAAYYEYQRIRREKLRAAERIKRESLIMAERKWMESIASEQIDTIDRSEYINASIDNSHSDVIQMKNKTGTERQIVQNKNERSMSDEESARKKKPTFHRHL